MNRILIKQSDVVGHQPSVPDLELGEIAINTSDRKVYSLSAVDSLVHQIAGEHMPVDAVDIVTGTVSTARLGTGTADATTFLRGDNTWAAPPATVTPTTLTGDVTGTGTGTVPSTVVALAGTPLGPITAASGNILIANGAVWTTHKVSGDGVISTMGTLSVNKTGGTAFAPSATIDTTNAANIASGILAPPRLGTGTADATTFLRGDSTWAVQPPVVPGGIDSQIQFNNAGVLAGTNGMVWSVSANRLSITQGIVDPNKNWSTLLLEATWSNATTNFAAPLAVNVTDNGSGTFANLLNLQRNGVPAFSVDKNGNTKVTGGVQATGKIQNVFGVNIVPQIPGGRLTLHATNPCNANDLPNKSTLYYLPYQGNMIMLWNNTKGYFELVNIPDVGWSSNLALVAAANFNIDVFIQNLENGNAQLSLVGWVNDTTRSGTYITGGMMFYGTGANMNLRYVGTIRLGGVTGTCTDNANYRGVWNCYNQAPRRLTMAYNNSWTFVQPVASTFIYRAINNDLPNGRVSFVTGGDSTAGGLLGISHYDVLGQITLGNQVSSANSYIGVGLDSTTIGLNPNMALFNNMPTSAMTLYTRADNQVAGGFHSLYLLEGLYGLANCGHTGFGGSLWGHVMG